MDALNPTPYYLTLTPNPTIDQVILIDEFVPGQPVQSAQRVLSPGGKGLDASVALRHLGEETPTLFFAAGSTGRQLIPLNNAYGMRSAAVWASGETRLATVIAEGRASRHTHLYSGGISVSSQQYTSFLRRYKRLLNGACWVLTGGSLPAGLPQDAYRTQVELAHQAGIPTLLDTRGEMARLACPARPDILKMNRDEFTHTYNLTCANLDELIQSARRVRTELDLPALVLTCGSQGLYGFTASGTWRAAAPPQVQINAAGAGDAASAAIVSSLEKGLTWPEALRWAAAVAAASVLTRGTADLDPATAHQIHAQTVVEDL